MKGPSLMARNPESLVRSAGKPLLSVKENSEEDACDEKTRRNFSSHSLRSGNSQFLRVLLHNTPVGISTCS